MLDAGWKRLWARISKDLSIKISSKPASPTPSKDNDDSDTDLSGYNTYAPTPEPREPTPLPDDPWEGLELDRRRFHWDEERYHFERIFLKEALIDGTRSLRENEDGDRQACEKREAMESFRYVDPARFSLEQRHFQDHIDLPKKGWTREQIVAAHEASIAMHKWRQTNPAPIGSRDFGKAITAEEEDASDSWVRKHDAARIYFYGELPPKSSVTPGRSETQEDKDAWEIWRKGIHARVSRRRQREALPDAKGDASSRTEALQRIEDEERRDRAVLERALERAEEARRQQPPPDIYPLFIRTQEEMNDRFRVWDEFGVPLKRQNELARLYGFGERPAGAKQCRSRQQQHLHQRKTVLAKLVAVE
ncbi:hypothetical protein F4814DRAFT_153960 [Daldinia grandis]|nr:hypothetical protein F4814DRAFT_153960 [Daldinia grandis]